MTELITPSPNPDQKPATLFSMILKYTSAFFIARTATRVVSWFAGSFGIGVQFKMAFPHLDLSGFLVLMIFTLIQSIVLIRIYEIFSGIKFERLYQSILVVCAIQILIFFVSFALMVLLSKLGIPMIIPTILGLLISAIIPFIYLYKFTPYQHLKD